MSHLYPFRIIHALSNVNSLYWIGSTGWGKVHVMQTDFCSFLSNILSYTEYIKYYGKISCICLLTAYFLCLLFMTYLYHCVEDSPFSKVKLELKFCFTSILRINLFMRKLSLLWNVGGTGISISKFFKAGKCLSMSDWMMKCKLHFGCLFSLPVETRLFNTQ